MLLVKTLRSSTFRLALISIAVFGVAVAALFAYVYRSTTNFILAGADREIAAERQLLLDAFDRGGLDALTRAVRQRMTNGFSPGALYLIADKSFRPIAGNLRIWPDGLRNAIAGGATTTQAPGPKATDGAFLLRAAVDSFADGSHMLVGKNVDDLAQFTRRIDRAFAILIVFLCCLSILASVSVTRRTVGRIEAINMTSRAITEIGLGKRIPLRDSHDEWDQLAENLNSMLERVEVLMAEVKQVSDNVAHDLRTPLTRMRGRLERASGAPRDATSDQSLVDDTISDLDEVLRIFTSLTRISQIEASVRTAAFRTVDLSEVATQVGELFDAAAEDKGMRLRVDCDRPTMVIADRDLLFEALANLVDNAIKHGREGGETAIGVRQDDRGAIVSVEDDGPGIPPTERPHVFKRFYRLERSRCTPGNGLGLSLVAAVARLHGAYVELLDNAPGLRAEFRFPAQAPTRDGAARRRPQPTIPRDRRAGAPSHPA